MFKIILLSSFRAAVGKWKESPVTFQLFVQQKILLTWVQVSIMICIVSLRTRYEYSFGEILAITTTNYFFKKTKAESWLNLSITGWILFWTWTGLNTNLLYFWLLTSASDFHVRFLANMIMAYEQEAVVLLIIKSQPVFPSKDFLLLLTHLISRLNRKKIPLRRSSLS